MRGLGVDLLALQIDARATQMRRQPRRELQRRRMARRLDHLPAEFRGETRTRAHRLVTVGVLGERFTEPIFLADQHITVLRAVRTHHLKLHFVADYLLFEYRIHLPNT